MLNDYGKELFKPWCSVQNVVVALSVLFLMAVVIVHFNLNSGEIASWVQAVGSIAAIWGTFTVSNNQVKREAERKKEDERRQAGARYAVVKSASDHAKSLQDFIITSPQPLAFNTLWEQIFSELIEMSKNSLNQLPAHELGSYELVVNHISIAGAIANIAERVKRWKDTSSFAEEQAFALYRDLNMHCGQVAFSWGNFQAASAQ